MSDDDTRRKIWIFLVIGSADDQLWAYNPETGVYCQIDSCDTDEDTYYTVSDSLESFLINMEEKLVSVWSGDFSQTRAN